MLIPPFQKIMLPILTFTQTPLSRKELINKIIEYFELSESEKNQYLPSGAQTQIANRTHWAIFHLTKAGLIVVNVNKTIIITAKGIEIHKQNPAEIDLKFLKTLELYKKFVASYTNKKQNVFQIDKSELSPEETLGDIQQTLRKQVVNELYEKINSQNFQSFEYLVVKVIRAMGYGIEDSVIGKSGDGGIDAIIKEDKLGLDKIYLQAKRWNSSVSAETVRGFAGALSSKSSKKGIFITSSTFSNSTKEFVKESDNNIILIDGKSLAMYMYEYNIGTKDITTYTTKQLDNDFFDE